jgi:hypothetical protein
MFVLEVVQQRAERPIAILSMPEALTADSVALPMAMLAFAPVRPQPEQLPSNTLFEPVVRLHPAAYPIVVLDPPVVVLSKAFNPRAVLVPVVLPRTNPAHVVVALTGAAVQQMALKPVVTSI